MATPVTASPLLVRIPPQLKQWLSVRADENSRSMTGEIIQLIKAAQQAEQVQQGRD